jgi:hypothetical protein
MYFYSGEFGLNLVRQSRSGTEGALEDLAIKITHESNMILRGRSMAVQCTKFSKVMLVKFPVVVCT